jgi:hypothetical protein
MSFYFRGVPNFEYSPSNVQIKNLFRKNKIRDDIFGNLVYFSKYNILGNERPDQVAEKFYSDETLDWVILISNNIINIRSEWPLDEYSFNEYLLEKYGSYDSIYGIHHYETKELKNSSGIIVLPSGLKIQKDWKTNGNFIAAITKKISQIFCDSMNVITVTLNDPIENLKVGNSITISNISDLSYNGIFRVTSVFIPFSDGKVYSFTYEVDQTPVNLNPQISENNESVTFVLNENSISGNTYYFEYYDQGKLSRVGSSTFLNTITNYDYELNVNNKKREIFVLKPTYLGIVLNDAESYSNYKIGGEQYVNEKLKKSDNVNLYS